MGKVKDEQLFILIKNFLLVYLPVQRKASENTVKTYRTVLNQFLKYAAAQNKISITSVTFEMFSYDLINMFLDSISNEKGLATSTRNNRLAALRAFISYASACKPEYLSISSELSAIKVQKNDRFAKVDYMTESAVKALLNEPDITTEIGMRDQFFMVFLYDTGARIQEILNVKLCDIKLDATPTVKLFGKGRKIRIVPLMKETVNHLKNYLNIFHKNVPLQADEWLFYIERKGIRNAMCDDTARLRIQKYADSARVNCPEIPEKVYPHLWRHTRAMHLYQHGMDLTLISQWLGHAQLETTLIYAHADTEAKRKAIESALAGGTISKIQEAAYTVNDEEILKRLYGL